MRTVGEVLKQEREAKFYSIDEIEKATKIRKELLIALEKDEYHKLPPTTFVQGFIKNYGRFLGLDPNKLLAIYKRDFSDRKNPPKILQSFIDPLDKKKFRLCLYRSRIEIRLQSRINKSCYIQIGWVS